MEDLTPDGNDSEMEKEDTEEEELLDNETELGL